MRGTCQQHVHMNTWPTYVAHTFKFATSVIVISGKTYKVLTT